MMVSLPPGFPFLVPLLSAGIPLRGVADLKRGAVLLEEHLPMPSSPASCSRAFPCINATFRRVTSPAISVSVGQPLDTAGRMKQSDLDQAEAALPEPQPQAMTKLVSMGLHWCSWSRCFSVPPPCSTEAACGRASRSRPAGTKPDRRIPTRAAPFPAHHTPHNAGELRGERFSALAQN
jgi:hypothetical protein